LQGFLILALHFLSFLTEAKDSASCEYIVPISHGLNGSDTTCKMLISKE